MAMGSRLSKSSRLCAIDVRRVRHGVDDREAVGVEAGDRSADVHRASNTAADAVKVMVPVSASGVSVATGSPTMQPPPHRDPHLVARVAGVGDHRDRLVEAVREVLRLPGDPPATTPRPARAARRRTRAARRRLRSAKTIGVRRGLPGELHDADPEQMLGQHPEVRRHARVSAEVVGQLPDTRAAALDEDARRCPRGAAPG